jgi:hypothetical protein
LPARASSPRSGPIASWALRWLITLSLPKGSGAEVPSRPRCDF